MKQSEFINLVMPFKDRLFRLAKRLLVSKEEAEDATQEVFLKLWTGNAKIKDYTNLEAFAMTMTKNFCLDRLKSKQASTVTVALTNLKEEAKDSLQKTIEAKDSVTWVKILMDDLPTQQKIILQLREVEHYSFEEIEKIVAMKPIAIRVALSRARKTIREQLKQKHNYGIK